MDKHKTQELLEKIQRSVQAYREQYPSIPAIYEMLEHTAHLQEQNAVVTAEIQANNRELQAIVGDLAKTVNELVNAIMTSGRLNGKAKPQ